jgi:hypothetical protein
VGGAGVQMIQRMLSSYRIDRAFEWPIHLAIWRAIFCGSPMLLYPPHTRERMGQESGE